jgi:hypothetical protein
MLAAMLAGNAELARKLTALEKKYDAQFRIVFDAIPRFDDATGEAASTDRVQPALTAVRDALRGSLACAPAVHAPSSMRLRPKR